jgi:hypothetical protein
MNSEGDSIEILITRLNILKEVHYVLLDDHKTPDIMLWILRKILMN